MNLELNRESHDLEAEKEAQEYEEISRRLEGMEEPESLNEDESKIYREVQLKARKEMPKRGGEWDAAQHKVDWESFLNSLNDEERSVMEKRAKRAEYNKLKNEESALGMRVGMRKSMGKE